MKKFLSTVLLSLLFAVAADAANRKLFDEGWLFVLADSSQMALPEYNDSFWRRLALPHDWAITLTPDKNANTFAGAYPVTFYHRFMTERKASLEEVFNIGWYRKEFFVDETFHRIFHTA